MKIGVNGASGQLGAAVVRHLAERVTESQIVAISRTPSSSGTIDARFGDYDDPVSLATAYAGLDKLLLIPTVDLRPGARARQIRGAIEAATAAGVHHIVYVSSVGASDAPDPDVRAGYFQAEQALMRSGTRWSILRMAYYAEALAQEAQQMLSMGMLTGLAETPVNFVCRDDLAQALAGLLAGEGHEGAIYQGTGPACYTGPERAAAVAAASGQPMAFVTISADQMADGMAKMGLPQDVVNTVVSIQQGFARGGFDIVSGDVARLSGRPAKTLEEVLRESFAQGAN
jgi:NAD(P)H dehydrogenase (quinone)